jgi:hypothetical protein
VQEVATPPEFVEAAARLVCGTVAWDLAANASNAKAPRWLGPGGEHPDALAVRWHRLARAHDEWLWLNPPYGEISAWAAKCAAESWLGAPILLLVPAAVSTEWFNDYVFGKAEVYALRPRVTFVGHRHGYPKDLMLCVYRPGAIPRKSFDTWNWKYKAPEGLAGWLPKEGAA